MGPALELTSVPAWTTAVTRPDADLSGRQWSIIAFGPAGAEVARGWSDQISASGRVSAVRVHEIAEQDGDGPARAALLADLAHARVGWRLMIAGPADACLKVRALAMETGIADDEMTVASTDVASRSVQCVHCRTVTSAAVELEDVLACSGCGRNLLVYYHVSRRQGAHLGFMVDAEEQTAR
ncbi:dimethylamine monooxygenase subunit DmmA family protein [Mycolicibacterium hippocampi]|uniref:Dimethylamine monooxygenase subunit DmmA-like C-terminal domain-containing protein n=1 Tax=Mycolicibacterium hippocampi TaxID=659824 RepID=A0A7I9ZTT8_9MYCO|nr:dimethylamine monooxygenase subunit DmmA family protein [Mycolicibacterium hippocampi]GFH04146.1 hypothetical protein MHIP_46290 [Mycolicibacterium hippocampi]